MVLNNSLTILGAKVQSRHFYEPQSTKWIQTKKIQPRDCHGDNFKSQWQWIWPPGSQRVSLVVEFGNGLVGVSWRAGSTLNMSTPTWREARWEAKTKTKTKTKKGWLYFEHVNTHLRGSQVKSKDKNKTNTNTKTKTKDGWLYFDPVEGKLGGKHLPLVFWRDQKIIYKKTNLLPKFWSNLFAKLCILIILYCFMSQRDCKI